MRVGVYSGGGQIQINQPIPVYLVDSRRDDVTCNITRPASAGVNQQQTLIAGTSELTSDAFGGIYRLGSGFEWTLGCYYNSLASTIQVYLEQIQAIGEGNVTVTQVNKLTYTIEFIGDLAEKYVPTLQVHNDTQIPSNVGNYFWLTSEIVYARVVTNPWMTYRGLQSAGLSIALLPFRPHRDADDYTFNIYDISRDDNYSTAIQFQFGDSAAVIESGLNNMPQVGAGGVTVRGGPLGSGQVQIRMNSAGYFVRFYNAGSNNCRTIPCDRLTTLDSSDDGVSWYMVGASWTY